jgi:hypothetical protein
VIKVINVDIEAKFEESANKQSNFLKF